MAVLAVPLAVDPIEAVLVVVIVVLALGVVGLAVGLLLVLRRRSAAAVPATPEVLAPPPPPSPPGPPEPAPAPVAEAESPAAPFSPTQTPEDVDQRTPAELAAAAQDADQDEDEDETALAAAPAGPPLPIAAPVLATPEPARLRLLGLTLGMLTERLRREHPAQLGPALARLVDTDQEGDRTQLSTLALTLLGEDAEEVGGDGQLTRFLEEALASEVGRGFAFSTMPEFQQALAAVAPELREKLQTIVWARNADSAAILTTDDVETLERVAVAMSTALLLDTSYDLPRPPGETSTGRV